jgi:hypothetical protein
MHEDRAKANANAAKELEQVRQQSMTDQEKAVEAARIEGRTDPPTPDLTRAFGWAVRESNP